MPATIKETILSAVETAFLEITPANGYERTVRRVHRVGTAATETLEFDAINLIDRGDATRRKLVRANEQLLTIELECLTKEYVEAQAVQTVLRLVADVMKRMEQDGTWGDLAVRTTIIQGGSSPFEVAAPTIVNRVTLQILYRIERANPNIQAMI